MKGAFELNSLVNTDYKARKALIKQCIYQSQQISPIMDYNRCMYMYDKMSQIDNSK